jgi:hypothetical protein
VTHSHVLHVTYHVCRPLQHVFMPPRHAPSPNWINFGSAPALPKFWDWLWCSHSQPSSMVLLSP